LDRPPLWRRERNLADTAAKISWRYTALHDADTSRAEKTCITSLPTRDAQFYWDQAHIGFATWCNPRMRKNPESGERGAPTARHLRRPRRRAKRLYLVEFLAQWGDTKMAASRVLYRGAADMRFRRYARGAAAR